MMDSGCLSYMAHVQDCSRESPFVETMKVKREFVYVFLKYLISFPQDQGINFAID